MPVKSLYRCTQPSCDFTYEYTDFGLGRLQSPVPVCFICTSKLERDTCLVVDTEYQCWVSEGGCGKTFVVEAEKGKEKDEFICPYCKCLAKEKKRMAIIHGSSSNKGSLDVVIGRDAQSRWEKIHERQSSRDKIRAESGVESVTMDRKGKFSPLKGAVLNKVEIPDSKVNNKVK